MKALLKTALFAVLFLGVTLTAAAQSYAYVNSAEILSQMPERKQVQSALQDLQTQLQKKGQQMMTDYQSKRQDAAAKAERGELSPVQQQALVEELGKKEEELLQYEQEMIGKLQAKEQELLKPIMDKVNQAIQDVAAEGGYAMIFDAGVLLFAADGTDVSAQVKSKLGM